VERSSRAMPTAFVKVDLFGVSGPMLSLKRILPEPRVSGPDPQSRE